MVTYAVARRMALSSPDATEEPHFDLDSFRVRGNIFVTVPDRQHFRVFVDEHESRAAADEDPDAFERKAPKRLAADYDNRDVKRARTGAGSGRRRVPPR